jgi:protein arginine N-methyltransferase 7
VRRRLSLPRLTGVLGFHQALLADARRNRAFHRALAALVRPGSRVLDIGAGSGVWAVVAARLGARRVVAIEREPLLVPVIERLARENGVADRVEVTCADARRVRLPRAFDVVVSETVGNEAFDEGIVALMARARERFLRPGGALVPEWLSLRAAPAAPFDAGRLAPRLLSARSISALTAHVPRGVIPERLRTLAPSRELLRVDLRRARPRDALPPARTRFHVAEGRAVGGVAIWVEMGLAPGVRLSTRVGTTWTPVFLPIGPLPSGPGRLSIEVDWNPRRRRWHVDFTGDGGARRARHVDDRSPLFAWGVLAPAQPPRRPRPRLTGLRGQG